MECGGAVDEEHSESCDPLEVVQTSPLSPLSPLSSSPCSVLPSPFFSKNTKMSLGKPPSFQKPNRPPPLIQESPIVALSDEESVESSWSLLESPARAQRVFTEPQHDSIVEMESPEPIELVDLVTGSSGGSCNDAILLDGHPRIGGSISNTDVDLLNDNLGVGGSLSNTDVDLLNDNLGVVDSMSTMVKSSSHIGPVGTDLMKIPVQLAWEAENLENGGVGGACGAGKRPGQPEHHEQPRFSLSFERELVFPYPRVLLGVGGFSKVYKATYRGQGVAVKQIDPIFSSRNMMESLRNELEVLSKLTTHRNVITCLGGCVNLHNCYIVEELMDTDLHHLIHPDGAGLDLEAPPKPLPIAQVVQVGIDIARGLAHLHPNVLHRDLKPQNILVKNGVAKVADFGLSKTKKESYLQYGNSGMKGTVEYMSPESMKGRIDHKSDVYSFGILLWECFTGLRPYLEVPVVYAILFMVGAQGRRPEFPPSVNCPSALRELIQSCWREDPCKRPDCNEIIETLQKIDTCLPGR